MCVGLICLSIIPPFFGNTSPIRRHATLEKEKRELLVALPFAIIVLIGALGVFISIL
jgi:hypothetical protein